MRPLDEFILRIPLKEKGRRGQKRENKYIKQIKIEKYRERKTYHGIYCSKVKILFYKRS